MTVRCAMPLPVPHMEPTSTSRGSRRSDLACLLLKAGLPVTCECGDWQETSHQRLKQVERYVGRQETMSITAWIIFGLVAGALAKFLLPGDNPVGSS